MSRQLVNASCSATGGWCTVESGSIVPTSDEVYLQNQDLTAFANPIGMVSITVVNYGGKSFFADHLQKVLTKGKNFAINAAGELVERLPGAVRVYDIVRYGAQNLTKGSGLEGHHGVMNAYFEANINRFPGYRANDAPVIMLRPGDHAVTTQVFNEWAVERFGSTRNIDWTVITDDEIMALSKSMFDAAGVPQQAQNNYLVTFWYYINNLE